ncbi:MAG: serine hydrolase domain-containing protein [Pseudidiomarina maritima]|nr:serine hydrolase domain-containing protein [Pseudidiomarina maritima]
MRKLLQVFIAVALLVAASIPAQANNLDGIWRAKLEVQPGVAITLGLTIRDNQLYYDSPNQGAFDIKPTRTNLSATSVSFADDRASLSFTGNLVDGNLSGQFKQGRNYDITFYKLTGDAINRLNFEGAYRGNLAIDDQTQLPLVLHVAVLAEGYLATLDSPRQQSYGIPVSNLQISDEALQFNSPMLQASYRGSAIRGGYQGEFKQGATLPLTLLKNVAANNQDYQQPSFGEQGGAAAIVTASGFKPTFYGNHNATTLYEIGSVSKTMVSYLLADAIASDSVQAKTKLQSIFSQAPSTITLEQLATHTSGLPRLPANLFDGAAATNPYAHYGLTELTEALAEVELTDGSHLYSNFAYGVLAEAIAKRQQTSLAVLLKQVLFTPAGMTHAQLALADSPPALNLAQGHNSLGQVVPHWTFQSLAGAGAVLATVEDMSRYVQFLMAKSANQDPIVMNLLQPRLQQSSCCAQALGWMISYDDEQRPYAWHNGQTGGFSSFVGFYLDGSKGVVVLNNQATSVNEQALQLLTH